jgi:hypothetical protein
MQAARVTAEAARDAQVAGAARDRAFELADEVASRSGPLLAAEAAPLRAATVEVACGLEGLADALALATQAVRCLALCLFLLR